MLFDHLIVTRLQVKVKTFFEDLGNSMAENVDNRINDTHDSYGNTSKKLRIALAVLVFVEALLLSLGTLYFLFLMFNQETESTAGAIVILAIATLISLALWGAFFGVLSKERWVTGIIVTWQVMQFALATSFIQGLAEWQLLGWGLLGISLITFFVVLFPVFIRTKNN